jgi:two-component system cell cycle sensor histidine kinase/response regulator CckA
MNPKNDTTKRGTILTVDDDLAILILIQTILAAAEYRVVAAGSGKDAIRLARQKHLHIDVALLDVHVPKVQPRELAGKILSLRPKLPILFMSGIVDDEVIRIRLLDEYTGFLPKPFNPDGLLRAVQQAMEPSPPTAVAASE